MTSCELCRKAEGLNEERILWDSSHWSFELFRCESCGQWYLHKFVEDQFGDDDFIWDYWAPLTPGEAADIAAAAPEDPRARPAGLWDRLSAFMNERWRLVRDPAGRLLSRLDPEKEVAAP